MISLYKALFENPKLKVTPNVLWAKKGESFQREVLTIFHKVKEGETVNSPLGGNAAGALGMEARLWGPRREPVERSLTTGSRPLM